MESSVSTQPPRGLAAKARLRSRIICLSSLPKEVAGAIVDRIIEMERQVFTDSAPEKTKGTLLGQHDHEAWVMTLEADGRLVGYGSIRISHYKLGGRTVACWKSRAGVHPEFRGQNRTAQFPALLYWRYRLRFPFRQIYGMIGLMHPSSFKLFADAMPRMHPFPQERLSPKAATAFETFCEAGGYQPLPQYSTFVIQGTSFTKMDPLEARYWNNSNHPAVRYFLRHNPDFGKGRGILTFFPIDLSLMAAMVSRRLDLGGRMRRLWLRWHTGARLRERARMLEAVIGPNQLPEDVIKRVARLVGELQYRAGQNLIVHGEQQDAVYFLLNGSLLVHLPTPRGVVTVDQLAPGAIVGEIGALLGVPATATVQAMGKCTVLRLGPDAIAYLRKDAPVLMERLRQLMMERLQMNQQFNTED